MCGVLRRRNISTVGSSCCNTTESSSKFAKDFAAIALSDDNVLIRSSSSLQSSNKSSVCKNTYTHTEISSLRSPRFVLSCSHLIRQLDSQQPQHGKQIFVCNGRREENVFKYSKNPGILGDSSLVAQRAVSCRRRRGEGLKYEAKDQSDPKGLSNISLPANSAFALFEGPGGSMTKPTSNSLFGRPSGYLQSLTGSQSIRPETVEHRPLYS